MKHAMAVAGLKTLYGIAQDPMTAIVRFERRGISEMSPSVLVHRAVKAVVWTVFCNVASLTATSTFEVTRTARGHLDVTTKSAI